MTDTDRPGKEVPKEYRKALVDLIDNQGWRYRKDKKHPVLYPADRSQDQIVLPKTASDHRSWKNAMATIRRAGGRI